jgi:hypothetical protein
MSAIQWHNTMDAMLVCCELLFVPLVSVRIAHTKDDEGFADFTTEASARWEGVI